MYSKGSILGATAPTGAIIATTVLPQTGMSLAVQIALAAVAGLALWAVVYGLNVKFGKR